MIKRYLVEIVGAVFLLLMLVVVMMLSAYQKTECEAGGGAWATGTTSNGGMFSICIPKNTRPGP